MGKALPGGSRRRPCGLRVTFLAAIVAAGSVPIAGGPALAGAGEYHCFATHKFACDSDGCAPLESSDDGVIPMFLALDPETGTGELCKYTQCRGMVAARYGDGMVWQGQIALGPSNFVLQRAARGEDVEDEAMLPTLGTRLAVDPAAGRFLLTWPDGVALFGYSGTCERATAP